MLVDLNVFTRSFSSWLLRIERQSGKLRVQDLTAQYINADFGQSDNHALTAPAVPGGQSDLVSFVHDPGTPM
jgi:hypothetical protein